MMTMSTECQNYYVTRPGEEILQGRGRCPQCAAQVSVIFIVIVIIIVMIIVIITCRVSWAFSRQKWIMVHYF